VEFWHTNIYLAILNQTLFDFALEQVAHKASFGQEKQDHETLETILETVGKTL